MKAKQFTQNSYSTSNAIESVVNCMLCGDVQGVLKTLPAESVDCVVTSPPYWALRDYGVEGQLGLEPTFQEYLDRLCAVFDEVRRVLKPQGTCWVNMGDTYSGSCNGAGDRKTTNRNKPESYKEIYRGQKAGSTRLADKCLLQIPSRFAIAMCERGWILRNVIVWHKPNCMPSSVQDRFTVDFEYLFFFVKSKQYWFEMQHEPYTEPLNRWGGPRTKPTDKTKGNGFAICERSDREPRPNALGRNKRSVWRIPTRPYKGAHFAVFPLELCEIPIRSGCPEFICAKCGTARKPIFRGKSQGAFNIRVRDVKAGRIKHIDRKATVRETSTYDEAEYKGAGKMLSGYTDCGCDAGFEPGIVLDPFMGSGTTALVARRLGRRWIGIELNPSYVKLAKARLTGKL